MNKTPSEKNNTKKGAEMEEVSVIRFTKKKDESLFGPVKFVVLARAKTEIRESLNYVRINGGKICATDGHRLHVATIPEEYADGVYEVVKDTAKEIILLDTGTTEWPDVQVVIGAATGDSIDVPLTGDFGVDVARINRAMSVNEAINPDFIAPVDRFDGMATIFHGGGKPVVVRGNYGRPVAYIMPLRD